MMRRIGMHTWFALAGLLVACAGGAEAPAPTTGDDEQDIKKAKPKLEDCKILHMQVDSCLDELGSIGGSLEDCIDPKDRYPVACCKAYGKRFNYCR